MKPSPQGPIRIFTTRSGRKVELVAVLPECRGVDTSQERIIGVCPSRPGERNCRTLRTWKINGRFLAMGTHDLDIVDIPAEGLAPTVPPTGHPSPTPAWNRFVVDGLRFMLREADDIAARARQLLRDVERVPVVVPRGQLTEQHHGHDLEGAEPDYGGAQTVTTDRVIVDPQVSTRQAWAPAGDQTDWGRGPPLTERAARHQLLDELVTPMLPDLEAGVPGDAPLSVTAWRVIAIALREAGYGKPKEATAAGPPAK